MHCCNSSCKSCTCEGSMNKSPDEKREMNGFNDDLKEPLLHIQSAEATPSTSTLNRIMVSATEYINIANNIKETRVNVNKLKEDETAECRIKIKGMTCTSCSQSVEQALQMVEGVKKAVVGLALEEAKVVYDPKLLDTNKIIEAVEDSGFGAELIVISSRNDMNKGNEIRMNRNQVLLSCIFSVPVFVFSMILPMLPPYGNWLDYKIHNQFTLGLCLRWILSTPVQFIIGKRFYLGAYHSLKRWSANMDVLVALGTNAAYFYSIYVVIRTLTSVSFKGQDFFETSSMLISFILLGKYLEIMAKGKTSAALEKLIQLIPDKAYLLDIDVNGNVISETEIDTSLIEKNDIIKIVPGAKIPVDGLVLKGKSYANESMITGESRPVNKIPGDKVIGGTINENGCLLVKATHVGSETALSQIVQLVEAAQLAKAPVQKLADDISKFFVPMVVSASIITCLGWFIPGKEGLYPRNWIPKAMDEFEFALQFAISVLVVACPCALGLATPTAIMVASGVGASQGVLIKGGDALEKAHKVNIVVFDKTGTLTIGKPVVVSAVLFSNFSMEDLCEMTIAVEANSEHPIAKAVVAHAKKLRQSFVCSSNEQVQDVNEFEVHMGSGVSGIVKDKKVLVGNKRLMRAFNVPISSNVEKHISENEMMARTCVLVSIEGKIVGAFSVTDPVKPEAKSVISFLHSMDISTIIVTGDNWATANAIANEVGISKFYAEIDPQGKAEIVKDLQMKGMIVAMVGDGVNDSPALAAADVGMAIGAGTDIAIEAADVVLVKSNLEDVITAIDLSRKTMSRIWLNYICAFGYNILSMPIAAGVLYPFFGIRLPPWLAGACMAASSISVVSSSLLLMFYNKPLKIRLAGSSAAAAQIFTSNLV